MSSRFASSLARWCVLPAAPAARRGGSSMSSGGAALALPLSPRAAVTASGHAGYDERIRLTFAPDAGVCAPGLM